MPALPTDQAVPYVVAAYGVFAVLVGAYVTILRARMARRRRDDEH